MTQLVIGAALGFIAAQGGMYGVRQLVGWLQRDGVGTRLRAMAPSPGPALAAAFIKYAGPVGAAVALVTLGVWAVSDYVAARSVRATTLASLSDSPAPPPPAAAPGERGPELVHTVHNAEVPKAVASEMPAVKKVDPYADPDFQVHRKPHRGNTPLTLKETLLRRSEDKARADLLKEIAQHANRSQYDCESGDRAARYLKADLDVWGFNAWETKYFPVESYKGATLAQCKDIKNVVDPAALDLQSTMAQQGH